MGSIRVKGLGVVNIEGDTPNEAEQIAILNARAKDEQAPATSATDDSFPVVTPEIQQERDQKRVEILQEELANATDPVDIAALTQELEGGEVTIFPKAAGFGNQEVEATIKTEGAIAESGALPVAAVAPGAAVPPQTDPLVVAETKPKEGPLGLIPADVRGSVRETVESQQGLLQLLAEISPSIGGAVGGAALGAPFGPVGSVVGAVVGGLSGETIAQETGIAPTSDINLALSAAGPVLGPAVGGVFKGIKRLAGAGFSKLPFSKTARAKNVIGSVVEEFESTGTRILEKQEGLIARSASELYGAVRRAGVVVPGKALNNTRAAIDDLIKEMDLTKSFPEVRQALTHLKKVAETIAPGKASKILDASGNPISVASDVSIDTLVAIRQQMGVAVRRAESIGGVKLGSAKKAFATISDDLDRIAASPDLSRRGARLAKAAVKRAKLEFSVKDMEMAVARFTKDTVAKDGVGINITGLQKWLRDITNPKSKQFNKNFAESLKDEIPAIKERLEALAKIVVVGGSGGPGSIVVRGRGASAGVGLLAGFGLGGGLGAAVGASLGAQLPEMLTSILMTKGGSKFLEAAAKAGTGTINWKTWVAAGQFVTRALGEKDEGRRKAEFDRKLKLTSGQGN